MKTLLALLLTCTASLATAAETLVATGTVYNSEGKEKKFTMEKYVSQDGDKTLSRVVYKDMSGDVLTEEKLEVSKEGSLLRYDMDQKQLKQKAWVEVDPNKKKITYNLKKFRKRNYPITVDLGENFIVSLQITDMIRKNWDKLKKGEDVKIGLGVWDRQETIHFKLAKDKLDDKVFVVKMSPSNYLYRALVKPLYFTFDPKSKVLTSYKGRVTPKDKKGRSFYAYDGLVKYQSPKKEEKQKKQE